MPTFDTLTSLDDSVMQTRFTPDRDSKSISVIPSLYLPPGAEISHDVGYTLAVHANHPIEFDAMVANPMETQTVSLQANPVVESPFVLRGVIVAGRV